MATMTKLADWKADFITALRIIHREGLSDAFAHLSARSSDGNGMLFMPRKSPALVRSDELFFVDFEKPVPQSSLHQAIYKSRSDVQAVVHFHSPAVILLSVLGQTIRPMHNYSAIFYQGVPLYTGTGQVESPARAGEMAQLLGDAKALMLRGHGAVVVGQSIREVCMLALFWKSRRAFKVKPCGSVHRCLWSERRPRESPNGPSSLPPWSEPGIISRRNVPVDNFGRRHRKGKSVNATFTHSTKVRLIDNPFSFRF